MNVNSAHSVQTISDILQFCREMSPLALMAKIIGGTYIIIY